MKMISGTLTIMISNQAPRLNPTQCDLCSNDWRNKNNIEQMLPQQTVLHDYSSNLVVTDYLQALLKSFYTINNR